MMSRLAVFRADATADLGAGHVTRCVMIARALADLGWRCGFAVSAETSKTTNLPGGLNFETLNVEDGDEAASLALHWPRGCNLLVVDHYYRDAAFELACRPWAQRIVAIEDLPGRRHVADTIIDVGAINETNRHEGVGCYLAGPGFAAIHPAFGERRRDGATRNRSAEPRRALMSFGGGDVDKLSASVAAAVTNTVSSLSIDVVLGIAGSSREVSMRRLDQLGDRVRVHCGSGADQMAALMADSDLAIGAAGGTSWERCCLFLPAVAAVITENQRGNAKILEAAGAADIVDAVDRDAIPEIADSVRRLAGDPDRRANMAVAAGALCDGWGARRIAAILDVDARANDDSSIWLRTATAADTETILQWQSEPGARAFSHDPTPPEPDAHRSWMVHKLADPDCSLSIVMHGNSPAGCVRLDRDRTGNDSIARYVVSILISSRRQRQGLGLAALTMARRLVPEAKILAEILPGNKPSIGLFGQAGYCQTGATTFVLPPMATRDHTQRLPA